MANWDYLIRSVHYIHDGIAVDDPQYLARWSSASDIEAMWAAYWQLYKRMIRTGLLFWISMNMLYSLPSTITARSPLAMLFGVAVVDCSCCTPCLARASR